MCETSTSEAANSGFRRVFDGDCFTSAGDIWLNAAGYRRAYESDGTSLRKLLASAKRRGLLIPTMHVRSSQRPNVGEIFYSRNALERAYPQLVPRRLLVEKRLSYTKPSLRTRPRDLTDQEYNLFLTMLRFAILAGIFPTIEEAAAATASKYDTTRWRLRKLRRLGYLGRTKKANVHQRSEYQVLKGPVDLVELARKANPSLVSQEVEIIQNEP